MSEDTTANIVRQWAEKTGDEMWALVGTLRAATGERNDVAEKILERLQERFEALANELQ